MTPDAFVEFFGREQASVILRTSIAETAAPAMEAAIRGGFRVVEFTLTTPGAFDLVSQFAERDDGVVVGAGSVLSVDDAKRAVEAGARFLVSPVVDADVIGAALSLGVAMMPGTHTPTEMLTAHRLGAQLQKLFPAPAPDYGPAYIKSCLGPMPFLRIVPTNGVGADNARAHLDAGAFAVGFVNNLFDPADMQSGNYDAIEARARVYLDAVREPQPVT